MNLEDASELPTSAAVPQEDDSPAAIAAAVAPEAEPANADKKASDDAEFDDIEDEFHSDNAAG